MFHNPTLEHFKPILDDSNEVIDYKWVQAGFRLYQEHLIEKLSNDICKFINLGVLRKDFLWCKYMLDYHLKFLQENIGDVEEVIDEVSLKVA